MQLEDYGVDSNGELVEIDRVRRGKTDLKCPYCNGGLTAKKGSVKAHHFAHTDLTCKAVSGDRDTLLPLFDLFLLHLSAQEFDALKRLEGRGKIDKKMVQRLKQAGFVEYEVISIPNVGCRNVPKLTTLGNIVCGKASMSNFARAQTELILEKLDRLEDRVKIAYEQSSVDWHDLLIDLRIYCDRLRRLLIQKLYFLTIVADGDRFYKIGVTSRVISERICEIETDLKVYFQSVSIEDWNSWEYYGYLERYFLYKYHRYQYQIGSLTEYFRFEENLLSLVVQELRELIPKEILPVESEIISGLPSRIERQIEFVENNESVSY